MKNMQWDDRGDVAYLKVGVFGFQVSNLNCLPEYQKKPLKKPWIWDMTAVVFDPDKHTPGRFATKEEAQAAALKGAIPLFEQALRLLNKGD